MDYQEIYRKYQNAIKLRELSVDENYSLLREIFNKKIVESININAQPNFIHYLAGIRDVFIFVDNESRQVDFYREELDKVVSEK